MRSRGAEGWARRAVRRAAAWAGVVAGAAHGACGGSRHAASRPGDEHDEGAGLLAQASISLVTGDDGSDAPAARPRRRHLTGATDGTASGEDPYDGASDGDPYGGTSYASWTAPVRMSTNAVKPPRYVVTDIGLDASIEGRVIWPNPVPVEIATPCGPIPALPIGAQRGVRGAIVFIPKVATGREIGGPGRAPLAAVIVKHGCRLAPTAQLAVPLPGSVAIHGDGQGTRVRIAAPGQPMRTRELQEGGLIVAEVEPGVTRIDGEDGKLAAAWVIGIDSPYFSVTDDRGGFRIEQLAAGTYDLEVWQPPIPSVNPDGTFEYGAPIVVHRSIRVAAAQTAKVVVALPRH